jgi:hypothetical protein
MARRNVEKHQFIGALEFVACSDLNRVASVSQLNEIRPFDHATGVHIQAWNNAFGEHT